VVVRSEDSFVPPIVPHPIFEANHNMEVSKVQLERGISSLILSRQGIVGFQCSTINVGLRLTNVDLNRCPYQILTSMGGLKKA